MKNKRYLDYVRSLPCVICGNDQMTEAHHPIGDNGTGATGAKAASDFQAFPLCAVDDRPFYPNHSHHALHTKGHKTWEKQYGSQDKRTIAIYLQAIKEGVLRVTL